MERTLLKYRALVRLRPAIYFLCILAITSLFYCLVFYVHDEEAATGAHHYPSVNRNSHHQLLDELMRDANRHFIDNFHKASKNVPLNEAGHSYELANNQSIDYGFDLLLLDGTHLTKQHKVETLDFEPNTIEYYLRNLGFDLKQILRLQLENNNNRSNSRANRSSSTSLHHSQQQRLYLNRSTLFPLDFVRCSTNHHHHQPPIVFVTAFDSTQLNLGFDFIKSFESFKYFGPQPYLAFHLLIYDLGLYPSQLSEIETLCNSTRRQQTTLCHLRKFHFESYPSHVSDLKKGAYRSIIIQQVLRDLKRTISYHKLINTGPIRNTSDNVNLFWLDVHYRFIANRQENVYHLQKQTEHTSGVLSWPIEQPTSSLTHPRMFEYFHITVGNFYFHRMIRTGHLLISLNDSTWKQFEWGIMLPWVRCSLTVDCIAPMGSQWRGTCQLDKKPHYRYSGCHHYDMSAFNVILGIAFNFSTSIYSANSSSHFFTPFYNLAPLWGTEVSLITPPPVNQSLLDNWTPLDSYGRFDQVMTDADIPGEFRHQTLSSSSSPSKSPTSTR